MTDEHSEQEVNEEEREQLETDQDLDDSGDGTFLVHVCNVPPTSSLSDIGLLFAKAGLHHPFSFRVSESIVAVQLDTAEAVEAALALSGSILTPPKVGQINIPGQVIDVIQAPSPTPLSWPEERHSCQKEKGMMALANTQLPLLPYLAPCFCNICDCQSLLQCNHHWPNLKAYCPTTVACRPAAWQCLKVTFSVFFFFLSLHFSWIFAEADVKVMTGDAVPVEQETFGRVMSAGESTESCLWALCV